MQYELYLDVLLLTDLSMNLIVLFLTGKVLKIPTHFGRLLCAALTGAFLHMVLLIRSLESGGRMQMLFSAAVMTIMIRMAFSVKHLFSFLKIFAALSGISAMISGFMQAANPLQRKTAVSFVLSASGAYLILTMLYAVYRKNRRMQGNLYQVRLFIGEEELSFTGLLDTGNRLWDPVYHKPVHILEHDAVNKTTLDTLHFHLIPYHSIGKKRGLLPAVIIPRMLIETESGECELREAVIAISQERVSAKGRYQMILHEEVIG